MGSSHWSLSRLSPDEMAADVLGVALLPHGLQSQQVQPSLNATAIQSADDVMGYKQVAHPHEYLIFRGTGTMVPHGHDHRCDGQFIRNAVVQRRDEVECSPLTPTLWPVHRCVAARQSDNEMFRDLFDRHMDIDVGPATLMGNVPYLK